MIGTAVMEMILISVSVTWENLETSLTLSSTWGRKVAMFMTNIIAKKNGNNLLQNSILKIENDTSPQTNNGFYSTFCLCHCRKTYFSRLKHDVRALSAMLTLMEVFQELVSVCDLF